MLMLSECAGTPRGVDGMRTIAATPIGADIPHERLPCSCPGGGGRSVVVADEPMAGAAGYAARFAGALRERLAVVACAHCAGTGRGVRAAGPDADAVLRRLGVDPAEYAGRPVMVR
jgi:hypothetical protein